MRWFVFILAGCSGAAHDAGAPDLAAPAADLGAADLGSSGGADLAAFDPNGNFGSISLLTGSYMQGGQAKISATAAAQFTTISGETYLPATITGTFGACFSYTGGSSGGTPKVAYQSAGDITIAGATQPITLTAGANGMYTPFSETTSTLWSGGETLTLSAAGATVPAFSTTIVAPAPFALTAPLPSSSNNFTIALDQDLAFSWTGAGSATVEILLGDAGKNAFVVCNFPGASGAGTLPKAAFTGFAAGAGGLFSGSVLTSKMVAAGAWSISVSAAVPFVVNGQYMNIASVTFQ